MKSTPIATRTVLTTTFAVVVTLIGFLTLFNWVDTKNRDRIIADSAKMEIESIQLIVNDSYTLGDIIAIRKYLDTFSNINNWVSGNFTDNQGNELWKIESKNEKNPNYSEYNSDIVTPSGGLIGKIKIIKNHSKELSKWNEQKLFSFFGFAVIAMIVLIIQNLTLFKILKPVSELTSEIKREADQLNLELKIEKGEDDIYLVKKWFSDIANSWHDEKEKAAIESQFRTIGTLATQVAHDIRSPLAALENILVKINSLPETDRILTRTAVTRIKDIANNLLDKSRDIKINPNIYSKETVFTTENLSTEMVFTLVDPLISEKRMQYRTRNNLNIHFESSLESFSLFIHVQPNEIKRILSNLINNSSDSIIDQGEIIVSVSSNTDKVIISIKDNGSGIPNEILSRIGERGISQGKKNGLGLGLFHAVKTIENWNGSIEIKSILAPAENHGTVINIALPKSQPPNWFLQKINLSANSQIIILDDDSSIHGIWKNRFGSISSDSNPISIHNFYSIEDLNIFFKKQKDISEFLFFIDYELIGSNQTGLDLIETLGIYNNSILVTSRFDDPSIINRVTNLKMKLIPKAMANLIPLAFEGKKHDIDAVLIDDDELVHMTWKHVAKSIGVKLKIYRDFNSFINDSDLIHFETPIYIDVNLGNGKSGEILGSELFQMGYKHIHLSTGYDSERFKHLLKPNGPFESIIGKSPPF